MERSSDDVYQDEIKDKKDTHEVLEVYVGKMFYNLPILFIFYLILKCLVYNLSIYICMIPDLWPFVGHFEPTIIEHTGNVRIT